MTYENMPKNLTEKALLVRGGRPDYLTLSTAAFPVPTVDEAGAILEHSDTGDRYRWTSTTWAQIEVTKSGISPTLAVPFLRQLSTPTLAVDTIATGLTRDVTLTAGHGLTSPADLGRIMELADSTNGSFFMQSSITAIVGDVITLDTPINRVYLVSASLVAVSTDALNVDGSGTPVVFSVLPFALQMGNITRVMCEMRHIIDMDFANFGGLAALDNGVVLRVNNGDGTYRNLHNFKDNGDIIEYAFDHTFLLPKGGQAVNGFVARLTWGGEDKHDSSVRLDGAAGQSLELIVQDDLTALGRHHWTAEGSEVIP